MPLAFSESYLFDGEMLSCSRLARTCAVLHDAREKKKKNKTRKNLLDYSKIIVPIFIPLPVTSGLSDGRAIDKGLITKPDPLPPCAHATNVSVSIFPIGIVPSSKLNLRNVARPSLLCLARIFDTEAIGRG